MESGDGVWAANGRISARAEEGSRGQIPLCLRLGVTGHRTLPGADQVRQDVRTAIARVLKLHGSSSTTDDPPVLTVVSALADGADRIVAEEIINRREPHRLEVVLPLAPDDYMTDFDSDSQHAFARLLAGADSIDVVDLRDEDPPARPLRGRSQSPTPTERRRRAYLRCGQEIVDRVDVLIAVWDRQPAQGVGGTAQIVEYARKRDVPTFIVCSSGGILEEVGGTERPITSTDVGPLSRSALGRLEEFNRPSVHLDRTSALIPSHPQGTAAGTTNVPPWDEALRAVIAWAQPYFARSDQLARFYQRRVELLTVPLFALAAAAVVVVTAQSLWWADRSLIAGGEVLLMCAVVFGLFTARRMHLPQRWVSYRYLAEWMRSAAFLAMVQLPHREPRAEPGLAVDEDAEWLQRAFAEIWARRPPVRLDTDNLGAVRSFLVEAWIEDQGQYYAQRCRFHQTRYSRLSRATEVLFGLTIAAAVLHIFDFLEVHAWWAFLSIVIPAVAAAMSGFVAQQEYRRHGERYRRMVERLDRLRVRMSAAPDITAVREVATDTARLMREENSDWFGVIRLHDVELPF
jgi:hypothetical protein